MGRHHFLLDIFRRRAFLAAMLALVVFSALYQRTRKPRLLARPYYTSTARVLVKANEAPIRIAPDTVIRPDEGDDPVLASWFVDLGSIRRLIKQESFLVRVSERLKGELSPKELKRSVQAFPTQVESDVAIFEALGESEDEFFEELERSEEVHSQVRWIQFSAVAKRPDTSRRVVGATLEVFLEDCRHHLAGDALQRRREYEELQDKLERRLKLARRRFEKMFADVAPHERDPDSVRFRLQILLKERGRMRAELESLKTEVRREIPAKVIPSVSKVEARRQAAATRVAELEAKFMPGSRQLEEAQKSLRDLEALAEQGRGLYQQVYRSGLSARAQGLTESLRALDAEIETLSRSLPQLGEQRQLNALRLEIDKLEGTLATLDLKIFKLKLEERRSLEKGSLVLVKEPEEGHRLTSRRKLDGERGSILGLVVGSVVLTFVVLMVWEFLFLRETFTGKVEQYLGMAVLATVPPRSRRQRRRWERWKSEVGR